VEGVYKRFGGVNAINGAGFALRDGEILGFIGPNGAGKTTLFDVVSGFVIPDEGTVRMFGQDVTSLPPDARAKLGLVRSFQDAALFANLTVFENLLVALEKSVPVKSATMAALHLPNVRKSEARLQRRAERLIELSNLGDYSNKFVKELSTGTRRIVDLACILAAEPRIILLDEPSSGVAQRETEELAPLLLRIRQETGCAMLLIEHDMPLIRSVSDELIALDLGAVVTRGAPDEVIEHPDVVASYLGTSREVIERSGSH
jgi:branched-chain amino acid transport system ATP-binding protein